MNTNTAHLWTIVGLVASFLVAGLTAIEPSIPTSYSAIAILVINILTYLAHNSALITAGSNKPV